MTADPDPSSAPPIRELLLHLLEYTATDVIDELWPGTEVTLDEIAGQILARHAHEIAEIQREHLRSQGYELDCVCTTCSVCLAKEYIDHIDTERPT